MSQHGIVSSQMIEGGVDANLFENFLYRTLRSIRTNPLTKNQSVLVFMDNAVIHKHSWVLETC